MTNTWTSLNRNLAQNCCRDVILLGNMQANYILYKSTFTIEKTLLQILLSEISEEGWDVYRTDRLKI